MADTTFRVSVRGRDFGDWTSVVIRRSMLQLAATFRLEVGPLDPWPFTPPAAIALRLGRHVILDGWLEDNEWDTDAETLARAVGGRERTGDLVDCNPDPDAPNELQNVTVADVARQLAAPFGVEVDARGDMGERFPLFRLEPSETAWSAILRAARRRGLLAYGSGDGKVVLTRTAATRSGVDLVEGANVVRVKVRLNYTDRFSTYVVRGQNAGGAAAVIDADGRAEDPGVGRYRPQVVLADGPVSNETARLQAQFAAAVRAAKSQSVVVTVQDWAKWRDHDGTPGPLWVPNELVGIRLRSAPIAGDMLVQDVEFQRATRAGSQTLTTLTLVRPDAFLLAPEVEPEGDPIDGLLRVSDGVPFVPDADDQVEEGDAP